MSRNPPVTRGYCTQLELQTPLEGKVRILWFVPHESHRQTRGSYTSVWIYANDIRPVWRYMGKKLGTHDMTDAKTKATSVKRRSLVVRARGLASSYLRLQGAAIATRGHARHVTGQAAWCQRPCAQARREGVVALARDQGVLLATRAHEGRRDRLLRTEDLVLLARRHRVRSPSRRCRALDGGIPYCLSMDASRHRQHHAIAPTSSTSPIGFTAPVQRR